MPKINFTAKRIFQSVSFCILLLFVNHDIGPKAGLKQDAFLVGHQAGDEDDPFARWQFEWLRTRNPTINQIPRGIRQR